MCGSWSSLIGNKCVNILVFKDLKRKFEHTAQPIRPQTCLSPYPRNLHCLPLLCLLFHLANL